MRTHRRRLGLVGVLLGEVGVVGGAALGVEQHLRRLVVGPEPAVAGLEVGDRGLPGAADLVGRRVGLDVEEVVEVHGASSLGVGAGVGAWVGLDEPDGRSWGSPSVLGASAITE